MTRLKSKPTVADGSFEGVDAVVLGAGGYTATFLPELGMLGASLTYDGQEYLSLHGGVDRCRAGHTTGAALLYPWANRLSTFAYCVQGSDVSFDAGPPVGVAGDAPIHGTMVGASGWIVEDKIVDGETAVLRARFAFTSQTEQFRSFPFPHDLLVTASLDSSGLAINTTVEANAGASVPISFGWHPYFVWPGAPRGDLSLSLPPRDHLELDARFIPTGGFEVQPESLVFLGDGTGEVAFDDAYRLSDGGALFMLEAGVVGVGGRIALMVEFDDNYRYGQVYAPSGERFVAIEPMTAPINALVAGVAGSVPEGDSFSASFKVSVATFAALREIGA